MDREKLKIFLGDKVKYDPMGQMIFGRNKKSGDQLILDVRGWGTIQYMFKDPREAQKFQDDFGEFVVAAINEKISNTEEVLGIPDIRNKLTPVCHVIEMMERGRFASAVLALKQAKTSVNYLSKREVYKNI